MSEDNAHPHPTLALSTKVEEDFVAPLAAVRGALEILRDFSSLEAGERLRFIETALGGCARLQQGVDDLARTVYAAGQRTPARSTEDGGDPAGDSGFAGHIHFFADRDIVEIDFAGIEFRSAKVVDSFFDVVERLVGATERRWYFLVHCGGYSVWPEAWVAFAHRGKKLNVAFSRGTARYDESSASGDDGTGKFAPDHFATREAALARIEQMKS